jgi:DNA-binding MarR family transcriptional regulator
MAKSDDPTGPTGTPMAEQCLAVRVRLLNRRISRIYDAAFRPLGVTAAQVNLLSALELAGPVPAGRLADVLAMEISTLSRNARIMAGEGWVEVERADHGNGRILRLTEAGAQKLADAGPAWEEAQREARALLGEDGAHDLKRLGDAVWAAGVASAAGAAAG